MNLIIDQGNTTTKIAVFDSGHLVARFIETIPGPDWFNDLCNKFPGIRFGILSSVSVFPADAERFLREKLDQFLILGPGTPLPFQNDYESRSTLGYDRIAAAAGAFTLFPGSNVLIIDAGTAITIDFLSARAEFQGGNISPGIDMRFRSLHDYTNKLPLIEKNSSFKLLGKNTEEAIRGGVMNAIIFELDGYIDVLKERYSDLKIILTGGDSNLFDKRLKNSIFANSNLNLTGLNRILEHNVKNP